MGDNEDSKTRRTRATSISPKTRSSSPDAVGLRSSTSAWTSKGSKATCGLSRSHVKTSRGPRQETRGQGTRQIRQRFPGEGTIWAQRPHREPHVSSGGTGLWPGDPGAPGLMKGVVEHCGPSHPEFSWLAPCLPIGAPGPQAEPAVDKIPPRSCSGGSGAS